MDSFIGLPVLAGFFAVAIVMGVAISRTNFCTMGAVSDWINIGDKGRFGSWMIAIAIAILVSIFIEFTDFFNLSESRPPYRSANFAWPRYILGGIMFGVGMSLSGGCVSKNLVRFGGGNLKALVILAIAAVFAFFMTKTAFFEVVFFSWIAPLTLDLQSIGVDSQDIGAIVTGLFSSENANVNAVRFVFALATFCVLAVVGIRAVRNPGFFNANLVSGVVIGLAVSIGWMLSGGPLGIEWVEAAEWADDPPVGVGVQSYTFVNPLGEVLTLLANLGSVSILLTVGVVAALGLVVGSFLDSIVSRQFSVSWFASRQDFVSSAVGAVLMGIGGVLALGCSIGQGVTGISTLALGSAMALVSMIFGCASTLKVQFYRIMYEDAGFFDALVSGWVDMKLLPESVRKLEAL